MNESKAWRAVLFDWDGTLADTAATSFRCYVRMFADFGLEFDRARFAETYSPNWHHTYRCMGIAEEQWTAADKAWLRYFDEETSTTLIEGAREALETIERRGVLRGIVTSATRSRIERELAHLSVNHHFTHIVCGDDGPRRKPDPEALEVCLARLGVRPLDALYVGDSPEDIAMARAAGVYSVGIPGPYPNAEALEAAEPDLFAPNLATAISRVFG